MRTLFYSFLVLALVCCQPPVSAQQAARHKPIRIGVVGLVHAHVHWILGRQPADDIEIVGIAEPNRALAEAFSKQHGYSMGLVYGTMEEMIAKTKPDAVVAFNSIFDHLRTVEYCAPRGIHVMVEKPLAVSYEHAKKMLELAAKNNIQLLVNYETSWYGSNKKAYELVNEEKQIGELRKIVFHTGHQGPIEIGCNKEFLDFLTDPVLNGGGALMDFGCYGANLATWLMKGEEPISVTAITQQIKPDLYPKVEDEATILLTYPKTQVIIEASWNWPFGRKDMEVYGKDGFVFCIDNDDMTILRKGEKERTTMLASPMPVGSHDPFAYFANVINGDIKMDRYSPSAPANNEIVMKILQAAKESAKEGKTILWKERFKN